MLVFGPVLSMSELISKFHISILIINDFKVDRSKREGKCVQTFLRENVKERDILDDFIVG